MAFWGVEVKPGKPYTHVYDNARGRLRISQATLGNGKTDSKCTVQCNVGNTTPILLCNLISNVLETCHLELEFEEVEEVIFSVLGQRSVHLSGYYLCSSGRNLDGDETDSYGEDIAGTDTSGSYSDDEDEYESDFIDDDDYEMFPPSPRRKSGVVIEEIIDEEKPSNGKANRRRLKKKHQLSDSDDGGDGSKGQLVVKCKSSAVLESEDEDGFPISFSSRRKKVVKNSEANSILNSDETVDEDGKKKTSAISQNERFTRETGQPSDTSLPSETGQENNEKSKKKKKKAKDGKPLNTDSKAPGEEGAAVEPDQDQNDKEVGVQKDDVVQFGEANVDSNKAEADGTDNSGKTKKKKKKTKKGKITEAGVGVTMEDKAIEDANEAANNDKMEQDLPVNGELEKLPNQSEVVDPSVPSATNQETSGKQKKKNKKKRTKDDRGSDAEGGAVSDVNQTDAKKKKKENKNNGKDLTPALESGEQGSSEVTKSGCKTRSYSNGLVIEELAMGKPDGQRATQGKKVFVNYIGKLKNGKIFDSTVGKRPFGFRLGIGEVIKGWDVGVNGMRVGDKRRLTVPPSYGYGQKKTGPIPPNSWLTFDVELVSVK